MKVRFMGYCPLDFTNDKGGSVKGDTIYVCGKTKKDSVGYDCMQSFFVSDSKNLGDMIHKLTIGSQIELEFEVNLKTSKLTVSSLKVV